MIVPDDLMSLHNDFQFDIPAGQIVSTAELVNFYVDDQQERVKAALLYLADESRPNRELELIPDDSPDAEARHFMPSKMVGGHICYYGQVKRLEAAELGPHRIADLQLQLARLIEAADKVYSLRNAWLEKGESLEFDDAVANLGRILKMNAGHPPESDPEAATPPVGETRAQMQFQIAGLIRENFIVKNVIANLTDPRPREIAEQSLGYSLADGQRVKTSVEMLDWPGSKTTNEAKRYWMTRGFIPIELYESGIQEAEMLKVQIRQMWTERKLQESK